MAKDNTSRASQDVGSEDDAADVVNKKGTTPAPEKRDADAAAAESDMDSVTDAKTDAKSDDKAEDDKAADDKAADEPDASSAKEKRRGRFGVRPLALKVIGAAGLIAAGVMFSKPGVNYQNEAFVDQGATTEAATAAAGAAQRLAAVDYRDLDGYQQRLSETLTPKLLGDFNKSWGVLKQTYVQPKVVVDAKVTDTGITFLEGDRAEALVSTQITITQDGKAAGSSTGTYILGMQKIDGQWKVSSIPNLPS